jgi:molybdate transport system substrate-binding protein
MKKRSLSLAVATGFAFIFLFVVGNTAESAEVKVLCANGMQTVMEELAPKFERAAGHKLAITFATGGATVKRAQGGEPADVVIAPQPGIGILVKDGKAAADNATAIASTGISVAVRKGTPKPDISSPEALKRALLAAKSITYLNPADGGASGIHFAKMLDRLGIANEMKSKTVLAPKAGAVGALVANGEAELGVIQYQLLFSIPGIEIVGPLPGDLQQTTVFSAAIMVDAKEAEAGKTLLKFLLAPEAAAVIRAKGMDPANP